MTARLIRLRRPPVLSPSEEPFVPDVGADALAEAEARWSALCERNPRYFDGRLCHVLGVHRSGNGGAVLHVAECAYRWYAVQQDDFDLGVRPLGAKGLTVALDGRVLVGRRARDVAGYPGCWEFAPGGAVEPGEPPARTVVRELGEETGLRAAREPTAVAVLHDAVLRCWEVAFRIDVGAGLQAALAEGDAAGRGEAAAAGETTAPSPVARGEYDVLEWRDRRDLPPLTPIAATMRALLDG